MEDGHKKKKNRNDDTNLDASTFHFHSFLSLRDSSFLFPRVSNRIKAVDFFRPYSSHFSAIKAILSSLLRYSIHLYFVS